MKRQIIKIDEDLCNGCGQCITGCPEGALQLIEGKARLVSDLFCDGLGACIGACPEGAIEVEEREAEPYSERLVMERIVKQGPPVIAAHLAHLKEHGETLLHAEAVEYLNERGIPAPHAPHIHGGHGCPGSMARSIAPKRETGDHGPAGEVGSELRQWPVQLALVNPGAPYFEDADLLIAADCVPFAFGDFHRRFLKGKSMVMFCPKLDSRIDEYVDKLAAIFSTHRIGSVSTVRMEVPCCGGVTAILQKALEISGAMVKVKEYVITIDGSVADERTVSQARAL